MPVGGLETPRDLTDPKILRIAVESATRYARDSNFSKFFSASSLFTDSSRLMFADFRAEVILLGSTVDNRCLLNIPSPTLWINGTLVSTWYYSCSSIPSTGNENVYLTKEVWMHDNGEALDTGGTRILTKNTTLTLADVNGHSFSDETDTVLNSDADTFTTAIQRDPINEADNYSGVLYIRGVKVEYFPSVRQ